MKNDFDSGTLNAQPRASLTFLTSIAAVAIAYYVGAEAAFYVGTLSDRMFAPFWPPNVVLFYVLLRYPRSHWWMYILAALPAHMIAEVQLGMSATRSLAAFGTNALLAVSSAFFIGELVKRPPWFDDIRKTLIYLAFVGVFCPATVALASSAVRSLAFGSSDDYWLYWSQYFASNAVGGVALAPFLLSWFFPGEPWLKSTTGPRIAEATLVAVALVAVCATAFHYGVSDASEGFLPALLYAPLPLILYCAIRFGERGASGAILIVAAVVIGFASRTGAAFASANPNRNVLDLQLFLVGLAAPVLLLAAAVEKVRGSEQTARELAMSVLQAHDDERRQLARDLHEGTGQNLVAASLLASGVERLSPDVAGPTLAQLDDVLQRSIQDLRSSSYQLHPPLLDEAGLELALRSFIDEHSDRCNIDIELDVNGDFGRLSAELELALFRVAQEALSALELQASGSKFQIHLGRERSSSGQSVSLMVESLSRRQPEKKGFLARLRRALAPDPTLSSLGTAKMGIRLLEIGGHLSIARSERGAIVSATVPVPSGSANGG